MKRVAATISAVVILVAFLSWTLGCGAPAATPSSAVEPPQFKAGSMMDKIQKRGKLIVGVRNDVLYLGYLNPQTAKPEGYEVDLARELARAIVGDPDKVELKYVSSASRIPMLQASEVDLVIANFTVFEERKKEVDYGKPHLVQSYWAVVPKDSPYQKLSDLAGKKVSRARGSEPFDDALRAKIPGVELVLFATHPEAALALSARRADAYATDEFPSLDAVKKDPTLRRFNLTTDLKGVLGLNEIAAGFRKGEDDFVTYWNQLLDKLAGSGRLKELFVKNMPEGMDLGALPFK